MYKTQTISLNSINRNSNQTSSNFTQPISLDSDYKYVCLRGCNIPKSMYLIDSRHDTFILTESGGNFTINIKNGSYNVYELIKEVSIKMTDAGSYTYNAIFDLTTGKITFNVSNNGTFQPTVDLINDNRLGKILGFTQTINTFSSNSLQSDRVINLQLTNSIAIASSLVKYGVISEIYSSNTTDFGAMTFIETNNEFNYRELIEHNPKSIDIRIVDLENDGEILDLNGQDIQISLTFFNIMKTNVEEYFKKKLIDKKIEFS